jgi:hypothetical protein
MMTLVFLLTAPPNEIVTVPHRRSTKGAVARAAEPAPVPRNRNKDRPPILPRYRSELEQRRYYSTPH